MTRNHAHVVISVAWPVYTTQKFWPSSDIKNGMGTIKRCTDSSFTRPFFQPGHPLQHSCLVRVPGSNFWPACSHYTTVRMRTSSFTHGRGEVSRVTPYKTVAHLATRCQTYVVTKGAVYFFAVSVCVIKIESVKDRFLLEN